MGHKADQEYLAKTHRPADLRQTGSAIPTDASEVPPLLPPRPRSHSRPTSLDDHLEPPPPYTENTTVYQSQPLSHSWSSQDPRSSSTQSLEPRTSVERDGKRILLLVFVHGFLGNETSFQSFPAHVHNNVTSKLAESHVVHTKIYPKYKSRKQIEFARDAFSAWLRPHEGSETDVILLGHSMGGLLLSEVAVLGKHRLVGTINFDTPFLGMHPGVIASGLGSLFRRTPESPPPQSAGVSANIESVSEPRSNGSSQPPTSSYFGSDAGSTSVTSSREADTSAATSSQSSTPLNRPFQDPNYDPEFANDVRMPQRSGWLNALHFIHKHSDGLIKASQSYVQSHLEFGGAMADYKGLQKRYNNVRALERGKGPEGTKTTRVRFVNYYTTSTGRPKKPKEPKLEPGAKVEADNGDSGVPSSDDHGQLVSRREAGTLSPSTDSRVAVKNAEHGMSSTQDVSDISQKASENEEIDNASEATEFDDSEAMNHVDPLPIRNDDREDSHGESIDSSDLEASKSTANVDTHYPPSTYSNIPPPTYEVPNLPPLPPKPPEPEPFDASLYPEKDTRKLAEKDHARLVKAHKQAVKDRDKAITSRRKFLDKKEKENQKQAVADEKEKCKVALRGIAKAESEGAKAENEALNPQEKEKSKAKKAQKQEPPQPKPEKSKREKVFCMLPSKINGQIDSCWVRVFMPGMDEVSAHCGLFFMDGERYEGFVGDVAGRIWEWVRESRAEV